MNFKLIGLTGLARSGKDTVAEYLCEHHDFIQMSFAYPVKRMVCELLGCDEQWLIENKEEHVPGIASPRRLLQTLGTDWGRNMIDSNIWINIAHRQMKDLMGVDPQFAGVVFSDCRFNNEAEWIRGNGGNIWHITRPDTFIKDRYHVSEKGINHRLIDYFINNDGEIEDLHELIEELLYVEVHKKHVTS